MVYKFLKTIFKKEDGGLAAVEFALILPVLALTLVGIFEVTYFVYCNNKMNRVAQEISNIVTRGNLTKPQVDSILQSSVLIAQPFQFSSSSNVIVTAVSKAVANLPAVVLWRDSYPGGTGGSKISGGSLPSGISLGQTVVFTEVFYTYQPVITSSYFSINNVNIYALAVAVPRSGQMTTLPPS